MRIDGPVLETERLVMRPFLEADLDAYARIVADPVTMRWVGNGRPQTRDEAWRSMGYILGHWALRGYGLWAVLERATGALVGRIGLYRPEGWPGLEVGWLVDRSRWGEGLATEGAAAAMAHGFEAHGANHLISVILPENAASIRVAEKLGERFERRMALAGHDEVHLYGISRADWAQRSGR